LDPTVLGRTLEDGGTVININFGVLLIFCETTSMTAEINPNSINKPPRDNVRIPKLILSTLLTGIGVNIFIGEQFLSVILPGNAFNKW
jgi:hypothetical protein